MTQHDQARLERGIDALNPHPSNTVEEMKAELAAVGEAICGIQSTDDPDPVYGEIHDRLQARYTELKARIVALTTTNVSR